MGTTSSHDLQARPDDGPRPRPGGPGGVGGTGSPVRDALTGHWRLIVVSALVLAAVGVAIAFARPPRYTAESTVSIGRSDLASQSLPGYAQAVQNLADLYSRVVVARPVVGPVAEGRGVSLAAVDGRVAAAPVPESSVVRITARGDDEGDTVRLAQQMATSTRRYIGTLVDTGISRAEDLRAFRSATSESLAKRQTSNRLTARKRRDEGSISQVRVRRAQVDAREAELRAEGFGARYSQNLSPQSGGLEGVDIVQLANAARSDQVPYVQALGAGGLVVGAFVGLAIGLLVDGRRRRTARRA